ncbi:nuclease-related domain-containing DEAD/DEAH box helicase [Succinivibrio dextrinosolvens]|uniref:nuclease-related domain-containing DEAD/DEAH box helicase n=1 Tax=Succinivibrio dextrinosolvens TaxID=83771 RepID=UPI0019235A99|nr:NERD domain-containing protein [Succinivibrio dextrinosolvens]
MAIFIPTLEEIKKWRVAPTDGEWYLLNFLSYLDDSYEIYFNPYLNEDRPDVLIMRKDHGVLVIEVKDWNLANYYVLRSLSSDNSKGNNSWEWIYSPNKSKVKSPITQVRKYYENLMNFHIKGLLPQLYLNQKNYAIVSTMVFFYGTDRNTLFNSCQLKDCTQHYDFGNNPQKRDVNQHPEYNCIFSSEDLTRDNFNKLLFKNYIGRANKSSIFKEQIYHSFKQQLAPTEHMKNQGKSIDYTSKQMEIIYDVKARQNKNGFTYSPKDKPTINAYIRGTYGSGKTTVLAATAVCTYQKLKEKYPNPRILILCYNITLVNWLRDRLSAVPKDFSYKAFTICNYHDFINSFLNQVNEVVYPPDENQSPEEKEKYWEENYYGNYPLFEALMSHYSPDGHPPEYYKYDAVFIDEIQDFHKIWTQIIKNCFLFKDGRYFVFGDEKQNIYSNPLENKIIEPYFGTRNISRFYLKDSKRSNDEIQEFLYEYQKKFLSNKYEVDSSLEKQTGFHFDFTDKKKSIDYVEITETNRALKVIKLFQFIEDYINNKFDDISPNDITLLSSTIYLIRMVDAVYRYRTGWKTETVFETYEYMIMIWIEKETALADESNNQGLLKLLDEIAFSAQNATQEKQSLIKSELLTAYYLQGKFKQILPNAFVEKCLKYELDVYKVMTELNKYKSSIIAMLNDIHDKDSNDYENIRKYKKLHFEMNNGSLKLSTIHSFKGWESRVVFMLLDKQYENQESFAELVYTGLSRTKEHLVIVNIGNTNYGDEFKEMLKEDQFSIAS